MFCVHENTHINMLMVIIKSHNLMDFLIGNINSSEDK